MAFTLQRFRPDRLIAETSHDFQDTSTSTPPTAVDFTAYVNFLNSHGHNVTILWKKDLPTYCNWGAGGTWHMAPFRGNARAGTAERRSLQTDCRLLT